MTTIAPWGFTNTTLYNTGKYVNCSGFSFCFYAYFLFYTLSLLFAVLLCLAIFGILRAAVKILLFSSHERKTKRERKREEEQEEHNSFALITGPTIRIPFARRISPKFDNNNKIARSQTYCYKQLSAHLVSFACKEAGEEAEQEEAEERATVSSKRTKQ